MTTAFLRAPRVPILASILLASLACGRAALASEPVPGGATEAPISTADQIDAFIKSHPAPDLPQDRAAGVTSSSAHERSPHGFVEVGVGTGGYRSVAGLVQMPLGDTGSVTLAASDLRGRGVFGARAQSLGASLALGPAAAAAGDPHCARSLDLGLEMEPRLRRSWLSPDGTPVCRVGP
ncbi:hypothetical protein [Phenylobacterium soli]|uniref:Uncharacterized protein n=1 Tax=Phenylobacterium soli TaxID=2170551 RepID=A0A328AL55_9CAUL|nr:hypothetical protein [Phenylobacterium soli]RAK55201.1 hypothetical protein DJ017_12060 [Phenylobacterium soli]